MQTVLVFRPPLLLLSVFFLGLGKTNTSLNTSEEFDVILVPYDIDDTLEVCDSCFSEEVSE